MKMKSGESTTVLIFIPEGMVSLIIGAKGRQIKILTTDSGTDIVVNQPIHRMSHRTVKVEGQPRNIARAIAMIYGLLEERAEDFKDITEPAKPFNIKSIKVTAKFVIDHKVVGFIIGRNGQFTKYCLEKYDVIFKIVDQRRYQKIIRSYEDVAILVGKLRDVQKWSDNLIEKVHDYFNNVTRSGYTGSDNTKLLIPGFLVTKIIGARGWMIREIAARSGGTQIKILSDKSAERDQPEIVVSIAGSLKGKQEAAAIILEQIELFKNGGPVLTTGSCLNDNIATQYKNSVQGQESIASKTGRRGRVTSSESSKVSAKRRRSKSSSEDKYLKRKESDAGKPTDRLKLNENDEGEINDITQNKFYQDKEPFQSVIQNQNFQNTKLNNEFEEVKILTVASKPLIFPEILSDNLQNIRQKTPIIEEEVRMKPVINLENQKKQETLLIQPPKITYKLSLLFNEQAETKRCKDLIDTYNK